MTLNTEDIAKALSAFLPPEPRPILLHEPFFVGNENHYIQDCLTSKKVSMDGRFISDFEQAIVDATGTKHAILTVNGTAAIHLALLFADVASDDEVLVPTMSFVAAANAIRYCHAEPHFVDVDEKTLGVDPVKLDTYLSENTEIKKGVCINKKTKKPIRALIVMHTFGHPADLDRLHTVCEKYHLVLLEDAAEAFGTYYQGRHVGHHGLLSMLSFNGNKIITTGGGGAILTNDDDIAERIRHIATTARLPHNWRFEYDRIGFNYRMPNLNAALGLAQLEQLPTFLKQKRILAERYIHLFDTLSGVNIYREADFAKSNYWLNAFVFEEESLANVESLISQCFDAGMMLRPLWQLVHTMPMYEKCPRMDVSCSESLAKRIVCLPSSASLGK